MIAASSRSEPVARNGNCRYASRQHLTRFSSQSGVYDMRILIADKFEQAGVERLRELGCEVSVEPGQ